MADVLFIIVFMIVNYFFMKMIFNLGYKIGHAHGHMHEIQDNCKHSWARDFGGDGLRCEKCGIKPQE